MSINKNIFPDNLDLEQINAFSANCMVGHLGIRFTEQGLDYLRATMPVDHRTKQPLGLLHGGATAALAETMGSIASHLIIDNEKYYTVGIEVSAQHIKKATEGTVIGTVSPIHIGRTLHIWKIEVNDDQGSMIALCKLTSIVVEKRN